MGIKELKKELGLSNKVIAQFFNLTPGTDIWKGSFNCDCWESFACYLVSEKTGIVEAFVNCEVCQRQLF